MKIADEEVIGVVGIRGAGKSEYVKRLIRNAPRVVVFDTHDEYGENCHRVSADDFWSDDGLEKEQCRIAVTPDWSGPKELAAHFADFVEVLKQADHQHATLIVVEETALLRPRAEEELVALASQSRHWKMPLVLVSQRATMQPPNVRSQWSTCVSFRQNDPDDLRALAERIGEGKAARVAKLPRYRCVVWTEKDSFKAPEQATDEASHVEDPTCSKALLSA